MRKEQDYEDDGRTIADMSDVGPQSVLSGLFTFRLPPGEENSRRSKDTLYGWSDGDERTGAGNMQQDVPMSSEERRMWTFGAIRAALLVALVYIGVIGGVIGLMLLVWNH